MTDLPPPQNAAPRWMKVTLALSLIANLAVLGLVAGAIAHGPRGPGRGGPADAFGPYGRALEGKDRRELRGQILQAFGPPEARQDARAAHLASVAAALEARPFDPAALDAVFAAQARHMGEEMGKGLAILSHHLQSLPEAERLDFAQRLRREGQRD